MGSAEAMKQSISGYEFTIRFAFDIRTSSRMK
jgi:hypothetical protein